MSPNNPKMAESKLGYEIAINEFETVCLFLGCKVETDDKEADRIHEFCMLTSTGTSSFEPVKGHIYGVFLKSTKRWVRGKLQEIYYHIDFTEHKLFLIDRGDHVTVPKKYMVLLRESLNYPPRSLRIGLDGVLPDVHLCKEHIVYITGLLHKGTVYFKKKRTINNILFGKIVIMPSDKSGPIDLETNLLAKGLVKDSDNFEADVIQFFSHFKRSKKDFTFLEEESTNDKQHIELKNEKSKEDNHMISVKLDKKPNVRGNGDLIENNSMRRNSHSSSHSRSLSDTGYASDEDSSKIPFVHEDVKFMPAGFHPQQKKSDNRSHAKKEIHVPRNYYQIRNDKERANPQHRSRSLVRSSERSHTHIAKTTKSYTRESDIPAVDHHPAVSHPSNAETDESNSEKSCKKRVSWNSTIVQDDVSKISENIETDKKITRAFNLNFKSDIKMGDVNHSFSRRSTPGCDQVNFTEKKENQKSQSSLQISKPNNSSDENKIYGSKTSDEMLVDTNSILSDSANSSKSSVEMPTLSKKQQIRLLRKNANSLLNGSESPALSKEGKSVENYTKSALISGRVNPEASQITNSIAGLESKSKIVENSGNCQLNTNQSLDISGSSNNVSNFSNNSMHTTDISASSLNCSSNLSQTQNLSANSINSSGQTKSPYNLSGASSEGGSDISNLSKKQRIILLRKNQISNTCSNSLSEPGESIPTLPNQNLINNKNMVEGKSQILYCDKKSPTLENEERKQKVRINCSETDSSQSDSSKSQDQIEHSNESSKHFSEKEEKRQKLKEFMTPGEETRKSEYKSLEEDSYTTQRLLNNLKTAAGVLVHSYDSHTTSPVSTLLESRLDQQIIQKMEHLHLREMSRIQKYTFPIICDRKNVALISSPRSGKTIGYTVPLASNLLDPEFYLSLPLGCGPRAIVVTPYWQSGDSVAGLFRSLSTDLRVIHTYGGGAELEKRTELTNGCDVLVSTPKCLLRLLKIGATDVKRLCHIVLDDADILLEKFKHEIQLLIVWMDQMQQDREKKKMRMELHVVVSSSQWTAPVEELVTCILSNPTICIASQLEACVYAGIKPTALFVKSGKKLEKLYEILKEIEGKKRTVVMCKSKTDVKIVYNLLLDLHVKNVIAAHEDLSSVNMTEIPNSWFKETVDANTLWEQRASLPILVRSDEVLEECPVTNAQVLIHYNMPNSLKIFSLRFTCIMSNYRNILRKESPDNKCKVFILMDEENDSETPGVMKFMARLGTVLPEPVQQTLEKIEDMKQQMKITEPLCEDLKQYGTCWNIKNCSFRHVLSKEQALLEDIPRKGHVKILVQEVHNVCHFSARLLEHAENNDDWKKQPNQMMVLSVKMNNYYSKMNNKRLHGLATVGDMVTVESSVEVYHRAVILKLTKINKANEAETVDIRLIDNGCYKFNVKVLHLYFLPEELKAYPPAVVDVYLCHLKPKDLDISWSSVMRKWVESKFREARRVAPSGYLCGKIVLSFGRNIWLDPVQFKEYLPGLDTTVIHFSLRTDLLSTDNAVINPDHIANLRKLCQKADIEVQEQENNCVGKLVLPKPDWAWLPRDKNEVAYIVTVHSPHVLLLRLSSLSSRVERLGVEIQEYVKTQKGCNNLALLEVGDICLGRSIEGEMCRAIIHSKPSEDQVELFFVDYGDFNIVSVSDVMPISHELITKLPFQVIECYLAGVQFPNIYDSDWEDDVIDKIYNLSRNNNEVAVNLCVKVVGIESVGMLSRGRRYKVVLSNCENQKIINKELATAGLVMLIKEEKHFLDEPLYIEIYNSTNVDSDSEIDEAQDLNITTVVKCRDQCDTLPQDNVAVDENERIVQKLLEDLESGHLKKSDEFELEDIAATSGNQKDSSLTSLNSSRDSLPQIQYPINVIDVNEQKALNYSYKNSNTSQSMSSSPTPSLNYGKKESPKDNPHITAVQNNKALPLNRTEENIEILNKTYLESRHNVSSFEQTTSNTLDESRYFNAVKRRCSLDIEENSPISHHNFHETYNKVDLKSNNQISSPCAESSPNTGTFKNYFQELSPINIPTNIFPNVTVPSNLRFNSPDKSPSGVSAKSKFYTGLVSPVSSGSSGACSKLNLVEKLKPFIKQNNFSCTNLNESLKYNVLGDIKSDAPIRDDSDVAKNHVGVENDARKDIAFKENVYLKSREDKSTDSVQSSDVAIENDTSNVDSSKDAPNTHILRDTNLDRQGSVRMWVESTVQSDTDEDSFNNTNADCNLQIEQTNCIEDNSLLASSSTALDPLEEISDLKARCPMVLWHQDDEFVWIHIKLISVTQYKFTCGVNSIDFRAIYEGLPYSVCLTLLGAHDTSAVQYGPKAFHFEIKLKKILNGKKYFWPRLTQEIEHFHWLKMNIEKVAENMEESEDEDIKNYVCSLPHWNDNPVCSEPNDSDTSKAAYSELSMSTF